MRRSFGVGLLGLALGLGANVAMAEDHTPPEEPGLGTVTILPVTQALQGAAELAQSVSKGEATAADVAGVLPGGKIIKKVVKKADAPKAPAPKPKAKFGGVDLEDLQAPNGRHSYGNIGLKSAAKKSNTVAAPGVDLGADTAAIRAGKGVISGDKVTVNGRTYKAHGGRLYPVSGDGLHQLDRGAFKALQQYKAHGVGDKANDILDKMGIGDAQRAAAKNVMP